ncbi:aminoacyl-tRNA hydrolase [Patescibacteria group bacterium]|nr:aminoacyl-tRNA hydrolase [Patescibacteria group bacterium]
MSFIIAGLGNPGEEYKDTRHNTGRIIAEFIAKKFAMDDVKENAKIKALVTKGEIKGSKKSEKVEIVLPNNFMNRSGVSLAPLVTSVKKAHQLIVIYDDLDLALGTMKISFNRSSGGHRGLESIIKALKTQEFIRIRVGISPVTPTGKIKKPKGEEVVGKFIIDPFKKQEMDIIKKIAKDATEAVQIIISEGKERAMERFN